MKVRGNKTMGMAEKKKEIRLTAEAIDQTIDKALRWRKYLPSRGLLSSRCFWFGFKKRDATPSLSLKPWIRSSHFSILLCALEADFYKFCLLGPPREGFSL